jgi:hypothetical protein
MKTSKKSNHKTTRDFSFSRFFNPEKSPLTSGYFDKDTQRWVFDYVAKHANRLGRIVWNSKLKGTNVKVH